MLSAVTADATLTEQVETARSWLRANWSTDITLREWWRRLADAGYAAPTWPSPYGFGAPAAVARAIHAELGAAGVIGPPSGVVGMHLAGPTLLAHGSPAQRERYLPPLLRGLESWCQLFSEPGAGSDLPSLSTKAVRDGDGWLVTGQKVWNSGADIAQRGMLLARTSNDRSGRDGISYFLLDMDQPGIEVRPLRQMNGESHFCEVFLNEARVADDDRVGPLDGGWSVARDTMRFERAAVATRPPRGVVAALSGDKAGWLDRPTGEVVAAAAKTERRRWSGNAIPVRDLVALAREKGRATDPVLRQRLAAYWSLTEIHRLYQRRGADGSVSKLILGTICRTSRDLSFAIAGADAMLHDELVSVGLGSPGVTIGAGTDEIHRNTVGERLLGLPREADK